MLRLSSLLSTIPNRLLADEMLRRKDESLPSLTRQPVATVSDPPPALTRPRRTGVSTGLVDPGNLNPYDRPVLKNPDGSISTTSSEGVGTDKGETIIPTVVDGVRLSPEQAMAEFRRTGGNFGTYGTAEQGDVAATALHNDQAAYLARNGIGTNGSDTRPRQFAPPPPLTRTMMPSAVDNTPSVAAPIAMERPTDPSIASLGPPPIMIRRNNKSRPLEAIGGGDSLQRDEALSSAQQDYKTPFSKKDFALNLLSNFAQHGIPGAVSGAVGYGIDPAYRKDVSMGQDIADTRGRIQQTLLRRKADTEWMNANTDRQHKDAETYRILNPVTPGFSLSPGQHRFENGQDVGSLPDRPVTPHNPLIVEVKNPDGSTTRKQSDDYGKTWRPVEGLGDAPPPDASAFSNALTEQNIQEATAERDRIGASLKSIPPTVESIKTDPYTLEQTKAQTPNPAYTDLMDRYRELDDHIRTYRGQLKPSRAVTRGSAPSQSRAFSIRAYLSRNPGATEADARQFAASKYASYTIVP